MSSTPQKPSQKMCKSPKTTVTYQQPKQPEKHHQHQTQQLILNDYETLSTTCTIMGSNNIHLIKKQAQPPSQQPQVVTAASPAYSNPSPGYPPSSPYSSPASLKSPSPSLKPPTPQPTFPVMQIIHNNPLLARPVQQQPQQNLIKLKPQLNILPKPAASPQPSPKPSVSPQIVIPTNQQATLMPTAQQLVLNQMPVLAAPGVQLIFRPQAKIPTATATPHGLILQPGGQPLLQLQPPRSQPMVRVLTNGVQLAPPTTTTFVTQLTNPPQQTANIATAPTTNSPKKKPKKKQKKFDLADIMKISGIGDEDDIQFESDTSQNESEQSSNGSQLQQQQQQSIDVGKKMGNIQISTVAAQPTINATTTPVLQVLNQNFPGQATAAPQGIPFNPFITPNFTLNNGLMVQRTGGFKLTVGEDGRLILQHDPTLNQDLQSQLLLQSIFGLNGGSLVLQPSIDQQVHSQTVQTIQQQSVQTIQQQTVQSQTIQTVQQQTMQPTVQQTVQQTIQHQTVQSQPMQIVQPQVAHSLQLQNLLQTQPTIQAQQQQQQQQHHQPPQQPLHQHSHQSVQTQPVLKVQPFQKSQPPVHVVHPQPIQTIHHPPQQQQQQHGGGGSEGQQQQQQQPPPTNYVVNLTPEQLEQLKRNGQLTVNGQTIFMQRPSNNKIADAVTANNNENKNKLSPKLKPVNRKNNKIQASNVIKSILQDNVGMKNHNNVVDPQSKEAKSSLIRALQSPPKHILPQNHVQVQPQQQQQQPKPPQKQMQPMAKIIIQKSVQPQPQQQEQAKKSVVTAEQPQDVDRIIGQLLEENGNAEKANSQQQRVPTIELTPQKQQHLKSLQVQIQALLTQNPGDAKVENALKAMFAEQQKILASGKPLPPAIYHNNQLTIVSPSTLSQQRSTEAGKEQQPATPKEQVTTSTPTSQHHQQQPPAVTRLVPNVVVSLPGKQQQQQQVHLHHHHQQQQQHLPQSSTVHHHPVVSQTIVVTKAPVVAAPQQVHPCVSQHQVQVQQSQNRFIPAFTKAQLIEQQLNTDQNGAVKPDIHTPFRDKTDACKRLIRYHCFDQPVLSQKDLDKADEIFELTARHFIDKFSRMVDKYRYLLLKESMRQVQTSELMMLDRMFVAEEQQSLIRLRQEVEESSTTQFNQQPIQQQQQHIQNANMSHHHIPSAQMHHQNLHHHHQHNQNHHHHHHHHQQQVQHHNNHQVSAGGSAQPILNQEEYDEWACIQRELSCLHQSDDPSKAPKRSASSDSRLETLKRFRVDKHNKQRSSSDNQQQQQQAAAGVPRSSNSMRTPTTAGGPSVVSMACSVSRGKERECDSIDEQVQSAIDSILNLQQSTALDLDDAVSSILS